MQSNIEFIRNATFVFNYAGKRLLIDPMLAEKGKYPGFPGTLNDHLNNPLTEMPVSASSLFDVDAVLVSHLHDDHWDEAAKELLPKNLKVYAQNESDVKAIKSAGFINVVKMEDENEVDTLKFIKTACQHGSNEVYAIPQLAEVLGEVTGFYFTATNEKSVYVLGDTVWIDAVENILINKKPDVVIVHAGSAMLKDERLGAIIMGKEDILRINRLLPETTIIAIHMEAINHCVLSRAELKQYAFENNFEDKLIIPKDGEVVKL